MVRNKIFRSGKLLHAGPKGETAPSANLDDRKEYLSLYSFPPQCISSCLNLAFNFEMPLKNQININLAQIKLGQATKIKSKDLADKGSFSFHFQTISLICLWCVFLNSCISIPRRQEAAGWLSPSRREHLK